LIVKFNQSILLARKSVASFISGAYLMHNKKLSVYIIDSNSESDEEMSNISTKVMNKCLIADDNRNNCPVISK
jgi:superfamily I DNA and/or RNA helicase